MKDNSGGRRKAFLFVLVGVAIFLIILVVGSLRWWENLSSEMKVFYILYVLGPISIAIEVLKNVVEEVLKRLF